MMEVPCCRGLLAIAEDALTRAHRKIPLKEVIIGIQGDGVLKGETGGGATGRAVQHMSGGTPLSSAGWGQARLR
jgi:hypothetical protein